MLKYDSLHFIDEQVYFLIDEIHKLWILCLFTHIQKVDKVHFETL